MLRLSDGDLHIGGVVVHRPELPLAVHHPQALHHPVQAQGDVDAGVPGDDDYYENTNDDTSLDFSDNDDNDDKRDAGNAILNTWGKTASACCSV